jgi:hypothetical protein
METIASLSKALQEYERAGGFAPTTAEDTEDVALAVPAARVEPTKDATTPPHVDEGRQVSLPGPVEAAETSAPVAKRVSAGAVAREKETSPPGPVEDVATRALDEPATTVQELVVAREKETSSPGPVPVEVEDVATRTLDESAAAMQELVVARERRRHHPVQSPLKSRMSQLARLTSWPPPCKSWPSPRRWPGPPPRRFRWPRRQGRPFPKARRVVMPGRLNSRVFRGRLPPGLTLTLRTTRRPRRVTPWSVG